MKTWPRLVKFCRGNPSARSASTAIGAALREFARHHSLTLNLSGEVKGRIRGRLPPGDALEFLDRLATLHGFEWYFDGSVLHVTAASERQSRTITFRGQSEDALKTLASLGVTDERWRVTVGSDQRTGIVSGPPRFVAQVMDVLGSQVLVAPAQPAAPRKTNLVVIYRGSQVSTVRPGHLD